MSKTDQEMERIQEQMYIQHHERLNGLLARRLQTRTREQNLRGLFSITALAVADNTARNGVELQGI